MMKLLTVFVFFATISYGYAQKYFMEEIESDASCSNFLIVDKNGKEVPVIATIKSALQCPSIIDLYEEVLITYTNKQLVWYNISTQKMLSLIELYDDIDGISSIIRSPNEKLLMFVVVNQEKKHGYKEFCRIVVLEVNTNGKVLGKRKFDRPVNFACGSNCNRSPGLDFRFKDNITIEYRRHELIEDRPGEWETLSLK